MKEKNKSISDIVTEKMKTYKIPGKKRPDPYPVTEEEEMGKTVDMSWTTSFSVYPILKRDDTIPPFIVEKEEKRILTNLERIKEFLLIDPFIHIELEIYSFPKVGNFITGKERWEAKKSLELKYMVRNKRVNYEEEKVSHGAWYGAGTLTRYIDKVWVPETFDIDTDLW